MALKVKVPLNTVLADLDDALRTLLKRELKQTGFDGVEIAFDTPARDWSGALSAPTVNLFLYDLREGGGQSGSVNEEEVDGQKVDTLPPLSLEVTYAITAWTKAVEDEHRLLSQVLSVLWSYSKLPDDIFEVRKGTAIPRVLSTTVARPNSDKADFWTAVGGQYKASIDYVLNVTLESGAVFERGPQVRTQVVNTRNSDAPRRTLTEMHRFGGTIRDAQDQPVVNAFVSIPEMGIWTSSDVQGRFIFDRIKPGTHRVVARTADERMVEGTVDVPGKPADLVLNGRSGGKGAKK